MTSFAANELKSCGARALSENSLFIEIASLSSIGCLDEFEASSKPFNPKSAESERFGASVAKLASG